MHDKGVAVGIRPSGLISGAVHRYRSDLALAARHALFSSIGGSVWIPESVRKALFRTAGAVMGSPPGPGFVFAGDPANLRIGTGVYFNRAVFVEANGPVAIGDNCAFGMQSMVLTSHHPLAADGSWQSTPEPCGVRIGDRVWIGARAVILPGAVVDPDVVIAAGAVVSGHCSAHGLYGGVPAKRIRDFTSVPQTLDSPAD